ncbi:RING finger protein nhl-1 isoform X2 [Drosophila pseudoobscura]|uniref:RING finger protein nhl-1 isoform X2 n=1 Tax=Drosophila pseudoobscura pseudoobscura TaxID=46245 RepID=A0A6I8UU59_DROPS|nr:RING finger protein nhl-1 isoform X2 [Drosophila pseudoobscura]
MEQFEQLLTCCVCLDRYRIPKLLPCQHSFCMEPCMEGLVDYVRRQVKCPECRAEHRIPYNGVQAFPTNVTLQRFLELHIEITGELPDPTSGQIMERCGVCSEKAYLSHCAHCEKKICEDCKSAHMDILRREITRFNSQIRRSLHRLQDSLAIIEKNTMSLQTNAISVTEEIDEIYHRITKAIKDRSDQLKGEIDRYLAVELRNLTTLKENLDLEITNIGSNCDIVDKYMNETVEWDDCELMDTKEIFLKTVEFLRHFEYENNDYSRRVRFLVSIDPNQLVMNLATFGDLNIAPHSTPGGSVSSSHLAPPSGLQPGLMRSKSDHRLATQFRQQEERGGYNDEPVLGGRKFGERPQRSATNSDRYGESSRYGRSDYDYENDYENEPTSGRTGKSSRFRSRFVRSHQNDDSDTEQQQQQRQQELKERKDRVLDSEDVSRGQLSGIIRLSDCSRVVQRLADIGKEKKSDKKSDAASAAQAAVQAAIQTQKAAMQRQQQKSQQPAAAVDEDELARQKRKSAASSGAATSAATSEAGQDQRPNSERVATLKGPRGGEDSDGSGSNQASSPVRTATAATRAESKPPVSAQVAAVKKTQRSGSSDSSASTESSASSGAAATAAAAATASAAPSSSSQQKAPSTARHSSARDSVATTAVPEKKPFVSRFLPQHSTPATANGTADKKKAESSSSSEEETSSESESESEPETKPKASATSSSNSASKSTPSSASSSTTAATGSSTSGSSYRDRLEARRASRDDSALAAASRSTYATPSSSGYGSGSSSTARTRTVPAPHHAGESEDRYGSSSGTGSSYTSRFLNKSKSSAIVTQPSLSTPTASFDEDANGTGDDSDSRYGTGRSRYLAMKERRTRLARSRSSHQFGNEDDDLDEPVSPTTVSPSAYLASRYSGYGSSDLSRSRSSHALKSRDNSPITDRSAGSSRAGALGSNSTDNKDGEALSSWARYLKNKYGNKSSKDTPSSSAGSARDSHATSSTAASSSHAHGIGSSGSGRSTASEVSRRLSLGLPLRQANELASSDDDGSKNGLGSPTSPTVAAAVAAAGITGVAGTIPKQVYLRKRQQLFQLGGRGSEPGSFTWPRGLAVGPDNSIVVADSSNHRVQVFDSNGIFVKEFGEYGNGEGEFDCLAGVAVNRIGQYIIADRYNHRIQVLDPQGRFLRAFGSQGTADGKFNYPWGVTTDALGFIYVCDKENHRVQVFQSDGSFVGKFGSCGRGEGQLEHPHYIAVSNTNRVIVSDSNNHRIQIFDVNGKVLSTVGGEGSDDGQFKFPRGVAVDDQGYIFVADSGNNRIQIFNPDGSFLKTFGSWGSGDSEFKGLEGVAIMSNGNILVCDRENHRVQVF